MTHTCYCGKVYECPWCLTPQSFICPTLNGDENGNVCDECLEKFAVEMQEFADREDK